MAIFVTGESAQAQKAKDQASAAPRSTPEQAAKPSPAGSKPVKARENAAPALPAETPICSGELGAGAQITLAQGKSGTLDLQKLPLPSPAFLRSIGDTTVVQVEPTISPVARSMFFLFGKEVGATNLMFQGRDGTCAMVEVRVGLDTVGVQSGLRDLLPAERGIRVSAAANSLVLSGVASDAIAVERAIQIANAFVQPKGAAGAASSLGRGPQMNNPRIVNMLLIGAPQQVMLEVKVAEVSKTLLDRFGINFARQFSTDAGTWSKFISGFFGGGTGQLSQSSPAQASGTFTNIGIDAQKQDGLVKILAEPNVMAISGQEGSFLAGGKIFIPVPQTSGGSTVITLEEKEFGVGVRFTPTVLNGGRINLKVAPEVSELSSQGARITASGTGVTSVLPLITTRRAATTVQLMDGQSFAIGGLIKNNVTQNINAFPVLGELPVLGALFRSSNFQSDRSELVFIVTPRLVKPLPPDYAMPTDHFIEPTRSEFFMLGKMEGEAPASVTAGRPPVVPAAPAAAPPSGYEVK
jgi:pilus assembly protein CpaC